MTSPEPKADAWIFLALPSVAIANVMIPVLWAEYAFSWMLPIAVLAIESAAVRVVLDISLQRTLRVVILSNLASSIPGMVYVFHAFWWRTVYAHADHERALMQIPIAFVISWAIEYWVMRWRLKDLDQHSVSRAALWSNVASYLLLLSFFAAKIAKSYVVWEWGLVPDFTLLPEWALERIEVVSTGPPRR